MIILIISINVNFITTIPDDGKKMTTKENLIIIVDSAQFNIDYCWLRPQFLSNFNKRSRKYVTFIFKYQRTAKTARPEILHFHPSPRF